MRWLLISALAALALSGCKSLKEQQLGAYVGDKQTKVFYKNVGSNVNKMPETNRVYFRDQTEAINGGYTSAQESKMGGSADE